MTDTIYAHATAPGRAGIAVIRVSGPEALAAARALGAAGLADRRPVRRRLAGPRGAIDDALVLWFCAPASYTGEDVVEFHLHGSVAVVRACLEALGEAPGLRCAEAGEFTRRALLNGRLDLTQTEGLGDLLAAETQAQARQALDQMAGALATRAQDWRTRLVDALARVEATIDFADEDFPPDVLAPVAVALEDLAEVFAAEVAGSFNAERLRHGFEVALVGAPNVGKSTLLNAIAQRDAAITSEIAGTTRDIVEVRLDLQGLPVTVLDTAGLREPGDVVEAIGIDRSRRRAAGADLRVFLVAEPADAEMLGVVYLEGDIIVRAKADLRRDDHGAVSGRTGAGVAALLDRIAGVLARRTAAPVTITNARHRAAVTQALGHVREAQGALAIQPEAAAAELHGALSALDFLVGRVDVETVLDAVFRNFCIGK